MTTPRHKCTRMPRSLGVNIHHNVQQQQRTTVDQFYEHNITRKIVTIDYALSIEHIVIYSTSSDNYRCSNKINSQFTQSNQRVGSVRDGRRPLATYKWTTDRWNRAWHNILAQASFGKLTLGGCRRTSMTENRVTTLFGDSLHIWAIEAAFKFN